jgi:hypothetical protein
MIGNDYKKYKRISAKIILIQHLQTTPLLFFLLRLYLSLLQSHLNYFEKIVVSHYWSEWDTLDNSKKKK